MKGTRFHWLVPVVLLLSAQAFAQTYPSRPIRAIVPFSPGSASDIVARLIGPKLQESWGQQVVVDNRPSGGGIVAGGIVAAAAPDGHTIMITSSQFAGAAALYDKLPYESQGAIAKATTPEAFGRMVRDEIALRTKVFRAARAKPD